METKCFEIRDRMTFIPAIATKLGYKIEPERWLLRKCGYDLQRSNIILAKLNTGEGTNDAYEWSSRTMVNAHKYIEENFDSLESGAVIDVEFILGESEEAKISERLEQL